MAPLLHLVSIGGRHTHKHSDARIGGDKFTGGPLLAVCRRVETESRKRKLVVCFHFHFQFNLHAQAYSSVQPTGELSDTNLICWLALKCQLVSGPWCLFAPVSPHCKPAREKQFENYKPHLKIKHSLVSCTNCYNRISVRAD